MTIRIVAVLTLGALLVGCGSDTANEPTADQQKIVDLWAEAFLDSDPDAVAALFVEDGLYEERFPTRVYEGHTAIRQRLDEGFAFAEATEMTPQTVIAGDDVIEGNVDVIVVEWTISGTSAPGSRSPTDKTPFSVEAVTVFEMSDDLISKSIFYTSWDDLFN